MQVFKENSAVGWQFPTFLDQTEKFSPSPAIHFHVLFGPPTTQLHWRVLQNEKQKQVANPYPEWMKDLDAYMELGPLFSPKSHM